MMMGALENSRCRVCLQREGEGSPKKNATGDRSMESPHIANLATAARQLCSAHDAGGDEEEDHVDTLTLPFAQVICCYDNKGNLSLCSTPNKKK